MRSYIGADLQSGRTGVRESVSSCHCLCIPKMGTDGRVLNRCVRAAVQAGMKLEVGGVGLALSFVICHLQLQSVLFQRVSNEQENVVKKTDEKDSRQLDHNSFTDQ